MISCLKLSLALLALTSLKNRPKVPCRLPKAEFPFLYCLCVFYRFFLFRTYADEDYSGYYYEYAQYPEEIKAFIEKICCKKERNRD